MKYKNHFIFFVSILLLAKATISYPQDSSKTKHTFTKPQNQAVVKAAYPNGKKLVYHTPLNAPLLDTAADKTLKGQYYQVLGKVYHYQAPIIVWFYKNYMDTLNKERAKLKAADAQVIAQAKTINTLQGNKTQEESDATARQNGMGFLGLTLSKTVYAVLMWTLVIGLGIGLAAVIYLSDSTRKEAARRTRLYDELTEEFKEFKTKANNKEIKLARELQTERNKVEELMAKK